MKGSRETVKIARFGYTKRPKKMSSSARADARNSLAGIARLNRIFGIYVFRAGARNAKKQNRLELLVANRSVI